MDAKDFFFHNDTIKHLLAGYQVGLSFWQLQYKGYNLSRFVSVKKKARTVCDCYYKKCCGDKKIKLAHKNCYKAPKFQFLLVMQILGKCDVVYVIKIK